MVTVRAKRDLTSKASRSRLTARGAAYWAPLDTTGRALGYRRLVTQPAGRWYVRMRANGTSSGYRSGTLGMADDDAAPAGRPTLSYNDAVDAAREWEPPPEGGPKVSGEDDRVDARYPVGSVGDIVTQYLEWYETHKRSAASTRSSMEAHALPLFGKMPEGELTAAHVRRWHAALAKKPAHVRTGSKSGARAVRVAMTDDEQRQRKVTANRVLSILKAALNRRWSGAKVTGAWSDVIPFRGVERSRKRFLDTAEVHRLVNACEPDFRNLVLAAVYTGCRYGELTRFRVEDVRLESATLHVEDSKSGEPRPVHLAPEAVAFFETLTAGRPGSDLLFVKADGSGWEKSHQQRPMRAAVKAANIEPVVFHGLRHTYASGYMMNGGTLPALAKQLGHSSTAMVERHYGHLADSWMRAEVEKCAPVYGITPVAPVASLDKRKAARK